MVFVCLFRTYFTWYDNLKLHPSWRISFCPANRVVFHCISVPWWCRLPTLNFYTYSRAAPWSQQSRGWDLITHKAHLLHTRCLHPLYDMYCVLSNMYLLFFLTVSDVFFKKPGRACVPPSPWLLPSSERCIPCPRPNKNVLLSIILPSWLTKVSSKHLLGARLFQAFYMSLLTLNSLQA